MKRGLVDAIYWRLHTSYLRNNRKDCVFLLGMLLSESSGEKLKKEIGEKHFSRFVHMKRSIEDGTFKKFYGDGSDIPILPKTIIPEEKIKESEFHKKLMREGKEAFLKTNRSYFLGNIDHEVDLGEFGRCDFTIREGRTLSCIEVKVGEAKHDIIGQIDKYRMAFELDMCLGLYDSVEASVIARSFSSYVAGELSRLGVSMIVHDGTPTGLKRLN